MSKMKIWLKFVILILCAFLPFGRSQEQTAVPLTTPGTDGSDGQDTDSPESLPRPERQEIKTRLLDWLFEEIDPHLETEFEGYDGWYNNPSHPELGSADGHMIRLFPPDYSDGSYQPSGQNRPNPFNVSDRIMKGPIGNMSRTGKTAFLVFFGQQVVEEILDAQRPGCPPEYFNIKIPKHHEFRKASTGETLEEMPFLRSRYDVNTGNSPNNPRRQINEITPWIDGGLTYGTSKTWADTLRSFNCGMLASSNNGQFPIENSIRLPMANPPPPRFHELRPINRFFRLGNPRGNENTFLLTMGTMWFRFHNAVAGKLCSFYGTRESGSTNRSSLQIWNEERIFNEARKWVIAVHQSIIVYNWLPQWLGDKPLEDYKAWDPSIDPGIATEFQSAAMRFGHTLVTGGGYLRRKNCSIIQVAIGGNKHSQGVRTCNSFWNPQEALLLEGIEPMIMGLSSQPAEREDNVIVEDLRGRVFGPLEFSRRDLMAINIQRARDHAVPDYKTARRLLNLSVDFDTFQEMGERICPMLYGENPELFTVHLNEVYNGSVDNVDIWVGGLLETTDRPGPLFRTIIADQFRRIRDGDRFWFENQLNGLFSQRQISKLKSLTILDVILTGTDIEAMDIQENPFQLPNAPDSFNCQLNHSYDCSLGTCFSLPPLNSSLVEECTPLKTFDYFSGSELSYLFTFLALGLFIVGCAGMLFCLASMRERVVAQERKTLNNKRRQTLDENLIIATEWIGKKEGYREVAVYLNEPKRQITVALVAGRVVRSVDMNNIQVVTLEVESTHQRNHLLIRVPREYDLVLKFDTREERDSFISRMESFLGNVDVGRERREVPQAVLMESAVTFAHRQKQLDMFFRVVFAQAFGIEHDRSEILRLDAAHARDIVNVELTPYEFASALSMQQDSTFVKQMFALVDNDNNGYISFREFLDMIVIFAKGSAEDKAKLMFDMYDIDHSGKLTRQEFADMIRSLLELANQSLASENLEHLVSSMFRAAGLQSKEILLFEDFQKILANHKDQLGYTQLSFDMSTFRGVIPPSVNRNSAIYKIQDSVLRGYSYFGGEADNSSSSEQKQNRLRIETSVNRPTYEQTKWRKYWVAAVRVIENQRLEIFWLVLYTLVLMGIFIERSYYYSVEREHGGLRRIAGYGVTVTRGAASVMMFGYSSLLVTMCRNTITFLRDTFLHRFIPFDSAIPMHIYIAFWAGIFSIVHSIGHALNFYHISTQTADDLTCLFREYYHATDELPKFHYWCFATITGLTGVFLLMLLGVMYVFALPYARRHVFNSFWYTHNMYPIFYILMVLHGLGRLVQPPFFYYFFLGPLILYILDRLVTVSRKKIEISVVRAELLPSEVTMLQMKRPPNFEYRSGQWVRIACLTLNGSEYHPFTLSSAPHEDHLSVHVRALGPWTINLRRVYDPANIRSHAYPKLYLDGPYGDGHQDWFRYEISVLVGGGIGVTPFASILKDIAFKSSSNFKFPCKKVYFIWITRTQKHFEWMIDIIREVEEKDTRGLVSVHIFITQFYQKFDLRTTMLYICERHFQKISNKSLFTSLQAITHFGRPNIQVFLDSLQLEHPTVTKVGVFSCGPPPMTKSVETACGELNKRDGAIFLHHSENF